jgi:prefoldin subunit 5
MEQAASSERRISKRKRTLLAAKIVFADGASTVDCVIRDLSETGARIRVGSFATLPEDFRLVITGRGEALSAHMVWSHGDEIGVDLSPGKPAEEHGEEVEVLRRRIRELERTILKLQNRIQELSEG